VEHWGWEAWYTLIVVAVTVYGLVRSYPTDAVMLGGTVLVGLAGIISPAEMFSGFSNHGMLTVAALFVISAGLRETGALDQIGRMMLGRIRDERTALLALAPQVSILSAFLNNTAVVAMLVSVVGDWCRKNHIAPSRLLMPMSYLAILGGMVTLIGTSTNLLVDGLLREARGRFADFGLATDEGLEPFVLFEFAPLGIVLVVLGIGYLWLVGQRMLPDRRDMLDKFGQSAREYLVNLRVTTDCPLVGQPVEDAGLRRLPGLYLIEIQRKGRVIAPVEPDELILADDHLTFTGAVETIVDLERIRGLVPAEHADDDGVSERSRRYVEAVVSANSPVLEQTIRDANFRARYNAAVVAVHRNGQRLTGRVGDIVLRAGDTLLLQAGPHFRNARRNDPSFFLVSSMNDVRPVRHNKARIAFGLLGLLVLLLVLQWQPTVVAAFLVAGMMVGFRCISASDARRVIAWDVLLTIAASFGLGKALENSGIAGTIAAGVVSVSQSVGPEWAAWTTLVVILLLTVLCTELITNNAAAVLLLPFALAAAGELATQGVSPRPFAIAVAVAASASFATPIGYQTNMIVYGPGGYRFSDFLRVGIPLNLLVIAAASILIPWIWPFHAGG
jgi:di/tricarboxylate transporter